MLVSQREAFGLPKGEGKDLEKGIGWFGRGEVRPNKKDWAANLFGGFASQ